MRPMALTTAFDIAFAAGVCLAALALAGAAIRFLPRPALAALAALELGATVAAWVAFALCGACCSSINNPDCSYSRGNPDC